MSHCQNKNLKGLLFLLKFYFDGMEEEKDFFFLSPSQCVILAKNKDSGYLKHFFLIENFRWAVLRQYPSDVCGNVRGGPTLRHIYKENNCVSVKQPFLHTCI